MSEGWVTSPLLGTSPGLPRGAEIAIIAFLRECPVPAPSSTAIVDFLQFPEGLPSVLAGLQNKGVVVVDGAGCYHLSAPLREAPRQPKDPAHAERCRQWRLRTKAKLSTELLTELPSGRLARRPEKQSNVSRDADPTSLKWPEHLSAEGAPLRIRNHKIRNKNARRSELVPEASASAPQAEPAEAPDLTNEALKKVRWVGLCIRQCVKEVKLGYLAPSVLSWLEEKLPSRLVEQYARRQCNLPSDVYKFLDKELDPRSKMTLAELKAWYDQKSGQIPMMLPISGDEEMGNIMPASSGETDGVIGIEDLPDDEIGQQFIELPPSFDETDGMIGMEDLPDNMADAKEFA